MQRTPLSRTWKLHSGIDWAAPAGTSIAAASAGQVVSTRVVSWLGGRALLIDHGGGWQTLYGGLAEIAVSEGDCVSADRIIGTIDAHGEHGGSVLHFEIRRDGQAVDPMGRQFQ